MAGRHAFWLILDGDTPTSFRSVLRDDLVPTLVQLQRKQPAARLQWFERGQLWESPEAAKDALKLQRTEPTGRTRDWRPGGSHKDPHARYKMTRDQKRARWKKGIGRKDKPDFGGTQKDAPPGPKLNWKPAPTGSTGAGAPPAQKRNWRPASPNAGFGARSQKPNWKPASPNAGSGARSQKPNWKPASSGAGSGAPGQKPNWKPASAAGRGSGAPRTQKPTWKPASSSKAGPGFGPRRPGGGGPRRQGFGPKKPRSRGPR